MIIRLKNTFRDYIELIIFIWIFQTYFILCRNVIINGVYMSWIIIMEIYYSVHFSLDKIRNKKCNTSNNNFMQNAYSLIYLSWYSY